MQRLSDDYTESLMMWVLCSLRPAHGKQKVHGNHSYVKATKQKVCTFYDYKQNLESPPRLKVHKQMADSSSSECIITKTLLLAEFSEASTTLGELILQFLIIRSSNLFFYFQFRQLQLCGSNREKTVQYLIFSNLGFTSQ